MMQTNGNSPSVIYVGIGEFAVSKKPTEVIKTIALGSCVAVIALCKRKKSMGILHVQLPESSINPERAISLPGVFADTGIPAFLRALESLGCPTRELTIKLAGGAQIMDPNNRFNIGKRNVLAVKKVLWSAGLGPIAEDVGGDISRTVIAILETGKVILSSPGKADREL